jgi:hypothetical protein
MSSIYSALFTYRQSENRTPLEDFLSAALADLLNRMPLEQVIDFVADVLLGQDGVAHQRWRTYAGTFEHKCWVTQHVISSGRIDLFLEVDGRPVVVVENKVASPIRGDQLKVYGHWLAAQAKEAGWEGALVFLTYHSSPPPDFGNGDRRAYGVPWQHTCRWYEVWQWLMRAGAESARQSRTEPDDREQVSWVRLARELADFLRECNMASETMTSYDISTAEVLVGHGSAARIKETFRRIGEKVYDKMKDTIDKAHGKDYGPVYEGDGSLLWDWAYLKSSPRNANWFVAWGIRFPGSAWWTDVEPPLPEAIHAFTLLSAERRPTIPVKGRDRTTWPSGWTPDKEGTELYSVRPLHEFGAPSDEMTIRLGDWVLEQLESIKIMLPRLVEDARAPSGPPPASL